MKHPDEAPILFGPTSALFGVVTRPEGDAAPVACLMFNFGIHTHIGPRRIQVKLARLLAAEGIASLRFDLSGIGESPPPRTALPFETQALHDLKAAVDHIEATLGIRQIALIGLCSGVAHGLRFALQDPRVVGFLSFDGYRFSGSQANAARRFQRFLRRPWAQSVHWAKHLMGVAQPPKDNMLQTNEPEHPVTPADFARGMDTLVARDVTVHLIYSGTNQARDRDHDQLQPLRGAPFLDKVRYDFMPGLDHSFTLLSGQQAFFEATQRWMAEILAKTPAPSTASAVRRAEPVAVPRQPAFETGDAGVPATGSASPGSRTIGPVPL